MYCGRVLFFALNMKTRKIKNNKNLKKQEGIDKEIKNYYNMEIKRIKRHL